MAGNPIDETLAIAGATVLDECLKRAPSSISDADLDAIIAHSREERARFALAKDKKEAKKDGVADVEVTETEPEVSSES